MSLYNAFRDRPRVFAVVTSFIGYAALGVIAFAVVMHFWWPPGMSAADVARIANGDPTLQLAQGVISTLLAIGSGYVACVLSGSRGLTNSTLVGLPLAFYAALNIHLHANDAYLQHASQFLSAILLPVLGGLMRWRLVIARERKRSELQREPHRPR